MLKIEIIENKEQWDTFLTTQEHSNILQSWAWGEFQKELGRKIWRIGIYNEQYLIGVALAQLIPTKFRTHIYVSNGPVILPPFLEDGITKLTGYLKALGIQEKVRFVRMDPLIEDTEKNNSIMTKAKLKKATTHVQAENKWILDISDDEEKVLKEMEKSTRYEIKKSEKEGVVVNSSTEIKDYEEFEKIFLETVKRQKFIPHPIAYYKKQFEILSSSNNYRVFLAKKDSKTISCALIGLFGDTAFYLHAGSMNDREINKLMGPQAVVWGAIKYAKSLNMKYFDFWGITTSKNPKDPWSGFTRFKKGFGGSLFKTIRAYDLPLSPMYVPISILEKYREVWGNMYYKIKGILKK